MAVESVHGLGPEMALLFISTFHWLELSHMALRGRLGNVVELCPRKRQIWIFSELLAVSCHILFMEISEIFCILDRNPFDSLVKLTDLFSECFKITNRTTREANSIEI